MRYSNLVSFEAILKQLTADVRESFEKEFEERTKDIANEIMTKMSAKICSNFNCVVTQSGHKDLIEVQFTIKDR